jgi:hypothetical protein
MASIGLSVIIVLSYMAVARAAQDGPAQVQVDQLLVRQIESVGPTENLGVLQDALNGLTYRMQEPERYASTVYTLFGALHARGTADRKQADRLEQQYILLALDRPDRVSTLAELRLVLRLQVDGSVEAVNTNELRTKVNLLFDAWFRMERDTNAAFNFDDTPASSVSPPRGAGQVVFTGIDPVLIKDSRVREEYKAAIERNRAKAEEYSRRIGLRNIQSPFIRHAETFLAAALRSGVVTEAEVISRLNLVQNDKDRQRVEATLRARHERQ